MYLNPIIMKTQNPYLNSLTTYSHRNIISWSLFILLIFYSSVSGFTQSNYKLKTVADYQNGSWLGLGYKNSYFLNQRFSDNIKADLYQSLHGFVVEYKLIRQPLMYTFRGFNTYSGLSESTFTNDSWRVSHGGLSVLVDLNLLSSSKKITPFIGGGYQFSNLKILVGQDDNKEIISQTVTSCPVWNFGLMILPKSSFGVVARWEQSFPGSVGIVDKRIQFANRQKSFRQIEIALLFNIEVSTSSYLK